MAGLDGSGPDVAGRAGASALESLAREWQRRWPQALAAWSRYTRLRPPRLCCDHKEARQQGLDGSFAMIRLCDQSVVVDLEQVAAQHLEGFAVEILAHEIGHHVLAPATVTDHVRMIARMRHSLPTVENAAPMVANLYTDLLINDRLQRSVGLDMAGVYRRLREPDSGSSCSSRLWQVYMGIYEQLWQLPPGTLAEQASPSLADTLRGDAWLGARLVRSYAQDWLDGSGRFAALMLPHLMADQQAQNSIILWLDTLGAADGGSVHGLTEVDPEELAGALHPMADPRLNGQALAPEAAVESPAEGPGDPAAGVRSKAQHRQPFEFGEILRAAGLSLSDHQTAVRYYQERARGHLIPFPRRPAPLSTEVLPEGLEPWEFGDSLDSIDWFESVLRSPTIIPGVTTVQRVWGQSEGRERIGQPLDLDLYVDSSGSMPNPQRQVSYLTLAGAILCLSALRAGARVQATLWSGKHQVTTSHGFVRDEQLLLEILTGFYGGGTAFPIPVLRGTYQGRPASARAVHLLILSDNGVTTLFDRDERGDSGWDISSMALAKARGGGTLVLDLPPSWEANSGDRSQSFWSKDFKMIRRARDEQGWGVHRLDSWEDLVDFARQFSRQHYLPEGVAA